MGIREIKLDTRCWNPGENLSQEGGEYTHVTITYNISGSRDKIDRHIDKLVENECDLQKVDCVNTVIYWQSRFDGDSTEELNDNVKSSLKAKLREIFVDSSNLSHTTVTTYCMVGNIRAFAFELDA
ncbi:hypothetical protein [Salinivibrio kushneri]|uniref:hypothetical protein n=1 Tax=Salinivibrio kushneri TaxID=1908198 RepID=UPI000988BA4F|nr:hypothetical protein [Salinivibrio kushneri]OOE70752.1 hypothetical protein BZG19_05085 [Salinivibrio kushneri]